MSGPECLDRDRIEAVVRALGDRLDGGWLLVGGAAVAMWLEARRVTEDVDVVPLSSTHGDRLALMELAESLGLPIESVNSAAEFFVRRIEGWEAELEPLYEGAASTVYRPSATLMILLKLRRLSQRDLADCELVVASGARIDGARIRSALAALADTDDTDLTARRAALDRLVAAADV